MKIYTSYFSKIKELESVGITPIAICAKLPDWYQGATYKALAPTYDCLMAYKRDNDADAYTERYKREKLSKLSPSEVVEQLRNLSNGNDIALICYEKPSSFCHRQLVAAWLNQYLGLDAEEWGGISNVEITPISSLDGVPPLTDAEEGKRYRWFWVRSRTECITVANRYGLQIVGALPQLYPCKICITTLDYDIDIDKGERYNTVTITNYDVEAQETYARMNRINEAIPDGLSLTANC